MSQTNNTGKSIIRVLVMDDDETIRFTTRELLKQLGYEVGVAREGAEAVLELERSMKEGAPYDVVILDLTVSNGKGAKEVISRILKINPGIKTVISSGFCSDPAMSDYKEFGFSAVVVKPYNIHELDEVIDNLFTKRH